MCPGLINALLGEMERSSGRVAIGGRMAYVAQQAWILNETLKENILFGQPFDEARWESVIKVTLCSPEKYTLQMLLHKAQFSLQVRFAVKVIRVELGENACNIVLSYGSFSRHRNRATMSAV